LSHNILILQSGPEAFLILRQLLSSDTPSYKKKFDGFEACLLQRETRRLLFKHGAMDGQFSLCKTPESVSLKFVEHYDYVIICDLLTIVYTNPC
jgi:hypothetical protein